MNHNQTLISNLKVVSGLLLSFYRKLKFWVASEFYRKLKSFCCVIFLNGHFIFSLSATCSPGLRQLHLGT